MSNDITINPDTQLVILHTKIRGVETVSQVVRDEKEGQRHETERSVTRTIVSTREYKEAKRLEALARAAIRTFALHTPIGNISDGGRVKGLRERFERLEESISAHNAKASHHSFHASLLVLPIAAALGAEACRALCEEVTGALQEVTKLLRSCDISGVRSWRMRNRNLDALMPELIAQVLRTAQTTVADAQRELTAQIKDGVSPVLAAASLDLSQLEVAASLILPSTSVAA